MKKVAADPPPPIWLFRKQLNGADVTVDLGQLVVGECCEEMKMVLARLIREGRSLYLEDVSSDLDQETLKFTAIPLPENLCELLVSQSPNVLQYVVCLRNQLHISVLDPVVNHFHEIAGAPFADVRDARAIVDLSGDFLEDIMNVQVGAMRAAGHQRGTVPGSVFTAGGLHAQVKQAFVFFVYKTEEGAKQSLVEPMKTIDDRFFMHCTVGVVRTRFEGPKFRSVKVPPSDMGQSLNHLLDAELGCDVVFQVGEESFKAHKLVLVVRSPGFRAQFFGLIGNPNSNKVKLEDIAPSIFKALLHFSYSDELPDCHEIIDSTPASPTIMANNTFHGRATSLPAAQIFADQEDRRIAFSYATGETVSCHEFRNLC